MKHWLPICFDNLSNSDVTAEEIAKGYRKYQFE